MHDSNHTIAHNGHQDHTEQTGCCYQDEGINHTCESTDLNVSQNISFLVKNIVFL